MVTHTICNYCMCMDVPPNISFSYFYSFNNTNITQYNHNILLSNYFFKSYASVGKRPEY